MQLEARDKRALILGSIAIVLLLAYLLWPSSAPQSQVELTAASARPASAPPPVAPVPVQTVTATPAVTPNAPPAAQPLVAGAVPQGLVLNGVTGSGAIFGFPDGRQRFVPRGREVVPGLTLQGVALRHVILASGTSNFRLGFGGTAIPMAPPMPGPPAMIAPAAPSPAPPPVPVAVAR